ncbi:MAG: 2-hydroxyacyl-CoA dehydratase family protein [Intestinimonas sp.]|jgi:benzoyl-CoA reductase/2-hydroxyglutaryl-CoA dehydratase subunit BcrC/BadD/HgdB|nr:2-hydroxyacyl-CoA dehydratase family protein [Intestinimonas sp.]
MTNLETILQQLEHTAMYPQRQFQSALASGKKVVGCFPVYTPEPLAYAAGFLPMGMWGGQVEPFRAKRYVPAFCCPIMQANLEYGLQDSYKGMSAVMIPTLCDTFRCITQNWKVGVENIPMLAVTYPQNKTDAGVEFFSSELAHIRGELEKISGQKVTETALSEAIQIYNEHSRVMMEFTQVANDHVDIIRPRVRHLIMKSAWFMDKQIHTTLMRVLIAELKKLPVYSGHEKRVLLTGILAEPLELYQIMEDNHMAVVADDLGQETRQYRNPIPDGTDGLQRLAAQWKNTVCSLAHSEEKERVSQMVALAKRTGTDGVIACMMKFCDPEEYDLPLIKAAMKEAGIPTLFQEIDLQVGSLAQAETRIQAFFEML